MREATLLEKKQRSMAARQRGSKTARQQAEARKQASKQAGE